MFTLLKVEGEKNYHLRIAAILGDVEAEVSSGVLQMQNYCMLSI